MMNKVSRYLSRFSFLIALLFLTGCNTATLTIKATNASALKSFQTQSWLTPKANNKNASLFITVDTTNKKFTISLTQGGTVLTTELSDTNIASNTLFNYIVTPGTNMQAMDSYGALLWCNPDETNTPIHYRFIDMNATAKDNMLVGTTQSIANSQTTFETTGISLGCSANLILAAWNGNYSGMLSYGSKYAKANPTTHSFDTPMECFGYPAAGYTPLAPLAYVSSNGQYAIAQGSKSTTDTYGTIQAGIFNGNFWEGSLGTIMNPLSGYAPITLSASSDNLSDGSYIFSFRIICQQSRASILKMVVSIKYYTMTTTLLGLTYQHRALCLLLRCINLA